MQPANARRWATVLSAVAIWIAVGCSSGGGESSITPSPETAGRTPTATAAPPGTSTPGLVSTPTALSIPPAPDDQPDAVNGLSAPVRVADLERLVIPSCLIGTSDFGPGLGTVPNLTPTPEPEPGGDGKAALVEYLRAVSPVIDAFVFHTRAGDQEWSSASDDRQRATALAAEGRRLSQLCSAIGVAPRPGLGWTLSQSIETALLGRRTALSRSLEALRDRSDLGAVEIVRSMSSRATLGLPAVLESIARINGITIGAPGTTGGHPFGSTILGLEMVAPHGWVVVRDGIDLVLQAPTGLQRTSLDGLGPEKWNLGTALRARRFRVGSVTGPDGVEKLLSSLMAQSGDPSAVVRGEIAGKGAITRTYSATEPPWTTLATMVPVDDRVYLFELGCPADLADECAAPFGALMLSVSFVSANR